MIILKVKLRLKQVRGILGVIAGKAINTLYVMVPIGNWKEFNQ
jgi:hypothetical protein